MPRGWCCTSSGGFRAPVQQADGTLLERTRGTPQGSSVSPVLANLFLHYAFDMWLVREFSGVEFERYADDAVVHCTTASQARQVLAALQERMEEVGLALHPAKGLSVWSAAHDARYWDGDRPQWPRASALGHHGLREGQGPPGDGFRRRLSVPGGLARWRGCRRL